MTSFAQVARRSLALIASAMVLCGPVGADTPNNEERGLAELHNTLVNLLQALVERGILTREQAEAMVRDAQNKATAEVASKEEQQKAQEKAEANAVRVPYVPDIVKDEIGKQVVQELGENVKQQVVHDINSQGTLRAALPEWMRLMTWTADLRVRGEADIFDKNNATLTYLDFNQINSAGGTDKAGANAFLNTTNNQTRPRLRARFGFNADLGDGWSTAVVLATGSTGEIIATTNQTLGTYGAGYTTTIDQGFLRWTGTSASGRQIFSVAGGRFSNPWLSTDLIWYNDLTFEGFDADYRLNFGSDNAHRKDLFLTLGAFPIESFSLFSANANGEQKWLLGGQLGLDFRTQGDSRFRVAGAYYDYLHMVGQQNALDSTLFNWTAPTFVQKGNTLFDISNTNDPTVNLFALAANYRVVDVLAVGEFRVHPRYSLILTAEALRNIGYDTAEVSARVGTYAAPRTRGYRGDLSFGTSSFDSFGAWRGSLGYRYLQRDAVLDAFNDEDFHLGGTDTKGYTLLFDFDFNPHVWLRAKYMAASAIDGPPLNIDVLQIDLNSRF